MLKFELTAQEANYVSVLLAERPIKEAGSLALKWERQGNEEMARLNKEERVRIFDEVTLERATSKKE